MICMSDCQLFVTEQKLHVIYYGQNSGRCLFCMLVEDLKLFFIVLCCRSV